MSGSGIDVASRAGRTIFWVGIVALAVTFAIGAAASWANLRTPPFGSLGYLQTIRDLRRAGDEERALRELRADQRMNLQDIRSSQMLANVLSERGDLAGASDALAFAAEHTFDPQVQLRLAALLVQQGRIDEADVALGRALVLEPDRIDVLLGVGSIYGASGRIDRARVLYRDALERDPGSSDLRRALSEAGGGP